MDRRALIAGGAALAFSALMLPTTGTSVAAGAPLPPLDPLVVRFLDGLFKASPAGRQVLVFVMRADTTDFGQRMADLVEMIDWSSPEVAATWERQKAERDA